MQGFMPTIYKTASCYVWLNLRDKPNASARNFNIYKELNMKANDILNAALQVPQSDKVLVDMKTKKIKYIHNTQAVEVKGCNSFKAWETYMQNDSKFEYLNALHNKKRLTSLSDEQQEAFKGDY